MAGETETRLLQQAMSSGIASRKELANFMAQISTESGEFKRVEEGFRYTRSIDQVPVKSAFRKGPEVLEEARLEALNGYPEKLAELMYGGRMGTTNPAMAGNIVAAGISS